jgi:hypothetical protein
MKLLVYPLALALALALTAPAGAAPATPPERGRGWLTGAGLVLVGGSFVAAALGLGAWIEVSENNRRLSGYYPPGGPAPAADAAPVLRQLVDQRDRAARTIAPLLLAAAATLSGGLTLLLLDVPRPHGLRAALLPHRQGASLAVSGTF